MPSVTGVGATGRSNMDVVVGNKKDQSISVDNFLQLMVAQLTNQDFMNPMQDTQYVTQLAQFATMQSMQELSYNSKSNYVLSLVGKEVTVARIKLGGELETNKGPIEKISITDTEFMVFVGGKSYTLDQIMEIHDTPKEIPEDPSEEKPEDKPSEDGKTEAV